jgi:hypothetical protein
MWYSEHIRFHCTKLKILKQITKFGSQQYSIFWMENETPIGLMQIK